MVPLVGAGLGMAVYLGLRPYGDHSQDPAVALAAFAQPLWVVAHLAGMAALASVGWVAVRCSELVPGKASRIARWCGWCGLVGAGLVMPYYGVEALALHELGRAVSAEDLAPDQAMALVEAVRGNFVGVSLFAAGLLMLAAAGLLAALAWQRAAHGGLRWAGWPLGGLVALVLPQYYLPPAGRVTFGVAFAVAALAWAGAAWAQSPRHGLRRAPGGDLGGDPGGDLRRDL